MTAGFDRSRLPDPVAYFVDTAGLTLTGRSRWRYTRCEFHGGSDSMRVNTDSGGWICMACMERGGDVLAYHMRVHGLEFVQAARALGAWVDRPNPLKPGKPTTLPAREAMEVIAAELGVVWIVVADIVQGVVPSPTDWSRFNIATGRIEALVQEYRK